MSSFWPFLTLVLLGAYHGVNPAMGWLFAVALGLQERSRGAVLRALGPIALGHAASIAAVVALVALARLSVAPATLQVAAGGALLAFGGYKLVANRHPRWVGMRVGFRDLTAWSFLMSTAHGAGLMLVPLLLGAQGEATAHAAMHHHGGHGGAATEAGHAAIGVSGPIADLTATALHSAAMLAVMAVVALLVYEKVGLAILRRAWLNLDRIWALALVTAGVITLVQIA